MNKVCTKCETEKPLSAFCKASHLSGGLAHHCRDCKAAYSQKWYTENREYIKSTGKTYYAANKEKIKRRSQEWQKANPSKVSAKNKRRYVRVKDHHSALTKRWREENRHKCRSLFMKRHSAKMRAIPRWADRQAIERIYLKAAEWGFEVDHIVPLQGKTVCGLHCEDNLQLLSRAENISKGNRIWPDMP